MDENAPGPSPSSSSAFPDQQPGTSNGWSTLTPRPPPSSPCDLSCRDFPPIEKSYFEVVHVNGESDVDDEDLHTLLFGSSFVLAAGKDDEVLAAFQDNGVGAEASSAVFRHIGESENSVSSHNHQNGSSNHHFTVTSASPSSSNASGGEEKPGDIFGVSKLLSNTSSSRIDGEVDEEELTSSSFQNNGTANNRTDDEIAANSFNSQSDSGGISEEDARISSGPICSMPSLIPEHTLSDISGPCTSSLADKVPASVIASGDDGATTGCEEVAKDDSYTDPNPLRQSQIVSASTSSAAAVSQLHKSRRAFLIQDESSPSTSSLSDSDEHDSSEGHRMSMLLSKSCSLKDPDGLSFLPLPPPYQGIVPMTVDTCEDYFTRLHDIRINGCILEYTGIGKSLHDNGFAQSSVPLTPLNHYFEITILDPGEYCYISIGLARKDYNVHRNPGWCRGSIAYHADDGKIFIGGGVGTPLGPRCTSNDVLGCGVIFPGKYGELPEGSRWPWEINEEDTEEHEEADGKVRKGAKSRLPNQKKKIRVYSMDNFGDMSSESEDDIWWNNKNQVCEDVVKVFFMRNRKLLGMKEVRIPNNGFYPTIGMMSTNERVSVDLHPLTG